jgi:dethiobiotin synthetase
VSTVFVTASGTEVGKTFVCCRLIEELRATGSTLRVLKPLVTGFDAATADSSDPVQLLHAAGLEPTPANLDAISPWRFAAPLSPDAAARREGRRIAFAELVGFCEDDDGAGLTVIEGIGGVMVPIDERRTVLDWVAALDPIVLLVTGSYLGALSHTLTAVAALATRGIRLAGVVASESPDQPMPLAETVGTLSRFLAETPVLGLPRGAVERDAAAARAPAPLLVPLLAPYLVPAR